VNADDTFAEMSIFESVTIFPESVAIFPIVTEMSIFESVTISPESVAIFPIVTELLIFESVPN